MRIVSFSSNRAFWRLQLTTRMTCEFESRANCLARLEILSYSATTGMTFQLPYMLHTCTTFGNSSVTRSSPETFLECTLLSFSSHSLTHYTYIGFGPLYFEIIIKDEALVSYLQFYFCLVNKIFVYQKINKKREIVFQLK